mmetsp:Transcript_49923/g.157965  ORF Transcript_49923/g.157965 Transcript_49923/m.157965 type:complete len:267 (+) Transcript_49923:239-1039(+)
MPIFGFEWVQHHLRYLPHLSPWRQYAQRSSSRGAPGTRRRRRRSHQSRDGSSGSTGTGGGGSMMMNFSDSVLKQAHMSADFFERSGEPTARQRSASPWLSAQTLLTVCAVLPSSPNLSISESYFWSTVPSTSGPRRQSRRRLSTWPCTNSGWSADGSCSERRSSSPSSARHSSMVSPRVVPVALVAASTSEPTPAVRSNTLPVSGGVQYGSLPPAAVMPAPTASCTAPSAVGKSAGGSSHGPAMSEMADPMRLGERVAIQYAYRPK